MWRVYDNRIIDVILYLLNDYFSVIFLIICENIFPIFFYYFSTYTLDSCIYIILLSNVFVVIWYRYIGTNIQIKCSRFIIDFKSSYMFFYNS